MMSNHELETQNLHPTIAGDNSDSVHLPEELSEQNLEAVSGGFIPNPLVALDKLEDVGDEGSNPANEPMEAVDGPAGNIVEAPQAIGDAIENIF